MAGPVTLRAVPLREVRTLLAGRSLAGRNLHPDYPPADSLDAMAMLLGAHEAVAGARLTRRPTWWTHQIVVDGIVVGDVGFHGPPAAEPPYVVEIGYVVVPARRRQGLATLAAGLLLQQAWRDGADEVVARTEDDNPASQRVLAANGFSPGADGSWSIRRAAA